MCKQVMCTSYNLMLLMKCLYTYLSRAFSKKKFQRHMQPEEHSVPPLSPSPPLTLPTPMSKVFEIGCVGEGQTFAPCNRVKGKPCIVGKGSSLGCLSSVKKPLFFQELLRPRKACVWFYSLALPLNLRSKPTFPFLNDLFIVLTFHSYWCVSGCRSGRKRDYFFHFGCRSEAAPQPSHLDLGLMCPLPSDLYALIFSASVRRVV